jgi:DNA-binding response OmpR family regulator
MKILIVEDDIRIASLIQRGLQENGHNTETVHDAESASKMLEKNTFDLCIVDVVLPGMNGLEFCKQTTEKKLHLPIIILTALGTTDDKMEGFESGADDYLVKPFEMRELLARINAVAKRSMVQRNRKGNVMRYADMELDLDLKMIRRSGEEIQLTPKEFNLIEYMMANPERVLSRSEIADKVWDTRFDTGTNFIDVYVNYLRKKIDRAGCAKLIHTRPGMGFILKAES